MRLHKIGTNQTEVEFTSGTRILFSYDTPVAAYVPGKGYFRTDTYYSATTSRHITAWLGRPAIEVETKPVEFFDNLTQGKE